MKWDSPKHGDVEKRTKFAFIPVQIENDKTSWFEWYTEEVKYIKIPIINILWPLKRRYQEKDD